jgi:hypothetical protein
MFDVELVKVNAPKTQETQGGRMPPRTAPNKS